MEHESKFADWWSSVCPEFDPIESRHVWLAAAWMNKELREQVAAWMILNGLSSGHGDTLCSLLGELEADLATLRVQNAQLENDCNMLSLDRHELQERLAGYEDAPASSCLWSPDVEFEGDTWDSSCGAKWSFIEGGPFENNVAFCHKCGKPLIIKPASQPASQGRKEDMSTDTPLTDAAAELSGEDSVVYSEFARKLERTLATKELAETKLRAALKKALRCISVDLYPQLCCEIREALSTTIITDALDSYVDEKVKEATDLIGKRLEFECERAAKLDVRLADLSAASPPLPPQPTEQSK